MARWFVFLSLLSLGVEAQRFFRTVSSGAWEVITNWEVSDDEAFTVNVQPATYVPSFLDNKINVRQNHVISVSENLSIDELTIEQGGHLIIQQGVNIEVRNGVGVDLTLLGTLEERGTNSWEGGAKWLMGTNGSLIRTNNSSSNNWRDAYQGGIINIPATSNWIIRKISADNPSITTVGGMYYGNLIIENYTAAHWDAVQVGTFFTGASDYPRIKGNLMIGGDGTSTVTFRNRASNANPVLVYKNIEVKAGSTLVLDSTSAANTGKGFELQGNLIVNGVLTYVGTPSNPDRFIKFSGTADQSISGTGIIQLSNLVVDKPGGVVKLERDLDIDRIFFLNAGVFDLNDRELYLKYSGPEAISTVNGKIKSESESFSGVLKWNIGSQHGSYRIPFADVHNVDIPFYLIAKSGTVGLFSISTYSTTESNQPLPQGVTYLQKPKTIDDENLFVDRFWLLSATGSHVSDVVFSYAQAEATTMNENFKAIRYSPSADQWVYPPNAQIYDSDNNTVRVNDVNEFSKWTLVVDNSPLSHSLVLSKNNGNLTISTSGKLDWALYFSPLENTRYSKLREGSGPAQFALLHKGYYKVCELGTVEKCSNSLHVPEVSVGNVIAHCLEVGNDCAVFDLQGRKWPSEILRDIKGEYVLMIKDEFGVGNFKIGR